MGAGNVRNRSVAEPNNNVTISGKTSGVMLRARHSVAAAYIRDKLSKFAESAMPRFGVPMIQDLTWSGLIPSEAETTSARSEIRRVEFFSFS